MKPVIIVDEFNTIISKTTAAVARKLLKKNEAVVVSKDPFILRLTKTKSSGGAVMDTSNIFKYFMGDEKPVYLQNVSGGRITHEFRYRGDVYPFRISNTREPICVNNSIPWDVMKNDVVFRRLITNINLVKMLSQKEYDDFFEKRSRTLNKSKEELEAKALEKHSQQLVLPETSAIDQLREEVKDPSVFVAEFDEINSRIIGICQRLNPTSDNKIDPIDALDAFESMNEITVEELDYIMSHSYNDVIRKWALRKQMTLTGSMDNFEPETLAKSEVILRDIDDQTEPTTVVNKKTKAKSKKK